MAATAAKPGYGTLLQLGDGAGSETFTTIVEITNIGGPETKLNTADATHMESPNQFMEKIATILEVGAIPVQGNFIQANATLASLFTAQNAKRLCNWRIILPGADRRFEGAGFVASIKPTIPVAGKMPIDFSIEPSGKWSLVPNP
jgi:hypothetical protein